MHAIVRTTEAQGTLARLAPAGTVGTLPICGKSLLAHSLDDLAMAEVHSVDVIAGSATDAIAEQLGSGRRWGMELRYRASMDEVDVQADRGPVLVVDADRARGPVALELGQHASSLPSRGWRAYSEGEFTGVALLPGGTNLGSMDPEAATGVDVDAGVVIRLIDTADLLAAQAAALSNRCAACCSKHARIAPGTGWGRKHGWQPRRSTASTSSSGNDRGSSRARGSGRTSCSRQTW